jgi:hypothetical protein
MKEISTPVLKTVQCKLAQQQSERKKEGDLNARTQGGKFTQLKYLVREREGDLNARTQDGTV